MTHWEPVFDREADCKRLNLILSPGRVATTSIYTWSNKSGVKLYKSHVGTKRGAEFVYKDRTKRDGTVPFFLEQSRHILGRAIKEADPVRLVLPVRDPLARNLSAFRRFLSSGRVQPPDTITPQTLAAQFEAEIPADRLDLWLARNVEPLVTLPETGALLTQDRRVHRLKQGTKHILFLCSTVPDLEKCIHLSALFGHPVLPLDRDETARSHNRRLSPALIEALSQMPAALSPDYRKALRASRYQRLFYPDAKQGLPPRETKTDPPDKATRPVA